MTTTPISDKAEEDKSARRNESARSPSEPLHTHDNELRQLFLPAVGNGNNLPRRKLAFHTFANASGGTDSGTESGAVCTNKALDWALARKSMKCIANRKSHLNPSLRAARQRENKRRFAMTQPVRKPHTHTALVCSPREHTNNRQSAPLFCTSCLRTVNGIRAIF